jgi:hypothetical protein
LVGPVAGDIRNKRVVYIAPDDLLYKLPFETLLTGSFHPDLETGAVIGQGLKAAPFWITFHQIACPPSMSVLKSLRTLTKGDSGEQSPLIAFADPFFDGEPPSGPGKVEARNLVSRSLRLEKFRAGQAIEKIRLSPLPDTREEALFVAKILGASPENDGFLKMGEILGLDLNAVLVVLSACNTAGGGSLWRQMNH